MSASKDESWPVIALIFCLNHFKTLKTLSIGVAIHFILHTSPRNNNYKTFIFSSQAPNKAAASAQICNAQVWLKSYSLSCVMIFARIFCTNFFISSIILTRYLLVHITVVIWVRPIWVCNFSERARFIVATYSYQGPSRRNRAAKRAASERLQLVAQGCVYMSVALLWRIFYSFMRIRRICYMNAIASCNCNLDNFIVLWCSLDFTLGVAHVAHSWFKFNSHSHYV